VTKTPEAVLGRPSHEENEERFWGALRAVLVARGRSPAAAAELADEIRHAAAVDGWLSINTTLPIFRDTCDRLGLMHNRANIVSFLVGGSYRPPVTVLWS
jgi:hypothetical protein